MLRQRSMRNVAYCGYRYRSSVALAENFRDATARTEDGYGMEYGAGPSRIPYQAPIKTLDNSEASIAQFAPASTIHSVRSLRGNLASLQHGDYVNLEVFATRALNPVLSVEKAGSRVKRKKRPVSQPVSTLSRLELHTVIHHLLRAKQPILAVAIISHTATAGVASRPRRRRLFASRTLEALFDEIKAAPFARNVRTRSKWKRMIESKTNFTSNRLSVPASTHTLSTESQTLLSLLESLQEVRHRRPNVLYEILIRQFAREGRPDMAAKIFVGLVEEWVTEGRIAEGADIDDFCEGGGPSEKLEIQQVSDQMAAWWKGVRTWSWPGEVLSPHGRLDLWHPKNLSLGEKMKGFPMPVPTSPPTMVPAPDNDLLIDIIESLRLDPARSTEMEYTTSMRALAYLANTVLSRTLPISSLRSLFHAMSATVHRPPVYPEGIDPEKIIQSERWAYESFTQIHLALQSLLSAPPMSASSIQYAQSVERAQASQPNVPPHPPPGTSSYALPPLSWTSCVVLLRYGMSRLKMPSLATSLVAYMKQVFGAGHTSPVAHNIMFEAATRMRDNSLARVVARPLFGDAISQELTGSNTDTTEISMSVPAHTTPSRETLALGHPDSRLRPDADERSLTTLITHLNATSQTDVLVQLVYRLIPYLSYDAEFHARKSLAPPPSPNALPLSLYPVILAGLRKGGKAGLAQRVFSLALLAEEEAIKSVTDRHGPPKVQIPRLSIDLYTEMISVYANEVRAARPGKEWVKGWKHMAGDGVHRRDSAAASMAWRTYNVARTRWKEAVNAIDHARCAPTLDFFLAVNRACAQRWELKQPGSLDRRLLGELQVVSKDMTEFGFPLSPTVSEKLDLDPTDFTPCAGSRREETDPAVALAELWLRGESDKPEKRFTPL